MLSPAGTDLYDIDELAMRIPRRMNQACVRTPDGVHEFARAVGDDVITMVVPSLAHELDQIAIVLRTIDAGRGRGATRVHPRVAVAADGTDRAPAHHNA